LKLPELVPLLAIEMGSAHTKYGNFHNAHEHYAVLLEEVDEWWEHVKHNTADCGYYELLQVAAVALRWIVENGDISSLEYWQNKRLERD